MFDAADELLEHLTAVAGRWAAAQGAKVLTGASGDDAVELAGRRGEVADVTAEYGVGATDDAKSGGLEAPAEEVDAGEEGEGEGHDF